MEKDNVVCIFCLIYCTFQQEMYPEDNDIAPTSQKQCFQKTKALPYESESITPRGQKQCSARLKALLLSLQSIARERAEHCFGA